MTWEDIAKLKEQDTDSLISLLQHPDDGVRRFAARELGERKEPRAVEALITLLQDNKTVWSAAQDAAWALAEIGDKRAVEPLIAMLSEPFVTGPAIKALAKLHDPKAVEPIIDLFERTYHSNIATVLGNWGDLRAVEPLIRAMSHRDPHVRFYTARALGNLGDARAIPVLEWTKENDTDPITDTKSLRGKSVSYVAGKALEKIGRA